MSNRQKANEETKFTPQSAEAFLKGKVKIENKIITVPKSGVGTTALSAIDYLENYAGYIVKFEHEPVEAGIPAELRGKIVSSK